MQRVIWSPAALEDLSAIEHWYTDRDPAAGARVLRAIRGVALRLVDYPRIGRAVDEPFRVLGVRATPYIAVYRLRDGVIEIVRIRHARENWLPVEGEL